MSDIRRKITGPGFIRSLIRDNHGAIAVYIAIANCNALEATGNKVNGTFSFTIPQFVDVFITEPMKEPSTSGIHAEILGELDAGAVKDLSHDVVQIYRR